MWTLLLSAVISACPPSMVTKAHYIDLPTAEEISAAYPLSALNAGQEGIVVLTCDAKASGQLRNCAVTSEAPTGVGFGDAAIAIFNRMTVAPAQACGTPIDGMFKTRFRFMLPHANPTVIGKDFPSRERIELAERLISDSVNDDLAVRGIVAHLMTQYPHNPEDQMIVFEIARDVWLQSKDTYLHAAAVAMARGISTPDLQAIVAFDESEAGRHWKEWQVQRNDMADPELSFDAQAAEIRSRYCARTHHCAAVTPKPQGN